MDRLNLPPRRFSAGVRRFLTTEALYGTAIGMYTMVLNLHLLAQHIMPDDIGSLASLGILIMGAGALPASMLANRIGRKTVLVSAIFRRSGLPPALFGNESRTAGSACLFLGC